MLWVNQYEFFVHLMRFIYSSSVSASTHAHSSTPVPPSLAPFHGRCPQFSASQRPTLNLKCSSLVCACCKICPKDRGKYRKFCFVASEIERGQKSVLGKGPKQESLTVVGTCRDECNQGIEQKKVKRREHRSIVALSTRNVSLSTDDTCWMPRPTCEVKAPHM